MRHTRPLILALLALPAALATEPVYVSSREIVLEYATANDATVSAVELWISTDAGQSWTRAEEVTVARGTVRFTTQQDGWFGFYLRLVNAAGASGPEPDQTSEPTTAVVIDTTPPLVQLHEARYDTDAADEPAIVLSATLVEENLLPEGVRVFYRHHDTAWTDGGAVRHDGDAFLWSVPQPTPSPLDLRLVVVDRAGNRQASSTATVEIPHDPSTSLEPAPTTQPAKSEALSQQLFGGMLPVTPPQVRPVEPPVVAGTDADPEPAPEEAPATNQPLPTDPDPRQLDHLRSLAQQFAREGRYALAAARLNDALEVDPQDADLMVDLGSVLYRLGQYEQADERFSAALTADPDHTGALDGLALVAATQKRYPQAREYLERLRTLLPQSGRVWLRTGDIEHRLGNADAALRAWRRVLKIGDADEALREKAQRRLNYFSQLLADELEPQAVGDGQEERASFDDRGVRR